MSTAPSDPLATSAETWREPRVGEPAIPRRAGPAPHGVSRRERVAALHRRHLLREQRARDDVRRVAQARSAGGRSPTTTS